MTKKKRATFRVILGDDEEDIGMPGYVPKKHYRHTWVKATVDHLRVLVDLSPGAINYYPPTGQEVEVCAVGSCGKIRMRKIK